MDQQLKQRLIGVTIIVALVVIFVPMLFDKSDDKGKFSSTGIPSIPDDVLEKNIELPKTAEDIAPKEDEKQPVESGYKIVPLSSEDVPPIPKPAGLSALKPKPSVEGENDKPVVSEEGGSPTPVKSGKKGANETHPPETAKELAVKAPVSASPEPEAKPLVHKKHHRIKKKTKSALVPPQPAAEPDTDGEPLDGQTPSPVRVEHPPAKRHHSHAVHAHPHDEPLPDDTATMIVPETAKAPIHHRHRPKANKPKVSSPLPEADRDLQEEPVPSPARAESHPAKPKTSVGYGQKTKVAVPKKPNAAIHHESEHPVKANRAASPPTDANRPHAKPKAAKPAPVPVKPAKPAEPAEPD